jgi:NADH-quinone oxidoreductase subunit C
MTVALQAGAVLNKIEAQYPKTASLLGDAVLVDAKALPEIMAFLKNTAEFAFNYMTTITAVDYYDYFEVIYLLVSMEHNHSLTVKTRVYGREKPTLPSLVKLWHGADYQEREIYDLMGITFEGHPNMKRIVLWPEFEGHPQRRDYLR